MSDQGKDLRPARGYSWKPFEAGNEAGLKFGGYSARRIGQRAAEVTEELVEVVYPHLHAAGFVYALSGAGMARTRLEILHVEVEERAAAGKLNSRIIEDTTAASREDAARFAAIGGDPRSQAEIKQIDSISDLNTALLDLIAPEVPRALRVLLTELGEGDRAVQHTQRFVALLRAPEEEDNQ